MLAMLRGEKEGFLKLSISRLRKSNNTPAKALRENTGDASSQVTIAVEDSYERLWRPL